MLDTYQPIAMLGAADMRLSYFGYLKLISPTIF